MATIPLTISGIKEAQAQLKELGDEFDRLKDDPIESKRLAKEFNNLSKQVHKAEDAFEELNKSGKNLTATFEEIYGEGVQPMTTRIGELEDRMYELALAGQQNTKEFQDMAVEAGRLRQTILETDRQVDLLAENRGLSVVGTGFRQVGESLLRLDFEGASRDAKALNSAMTGLGTRGAQAIKGLGSTVVQLGKTFAKMGVALLANPIFLMATVVTALVGAIVALMNEMGVLQAVTEGASKVFEFFKGIIDTVVQALKDFTDWLGITNNAMKDLIEDQLSQSDEVEKRIDKLNQSITDRYDKEIKLSQIAGQETSDIEIEKQKALIETAKLDQKNFEERLKRLEILGQASEEDLQKIRDSIEETKRIIKKGNDEIDVIKAQSDADEKKRREDQLKADRDAYKQRLAEQKAFEEARLQIARQIQDLELQLSDEGLQKDLELNRVKYERLIEDVNNNEKLLAEERTKLIALYQEQEFESRKEIELGYQQQIWDALDEAEAQREADKEAKRQAELDRQEAFNNAVIAGMSKSYEEQFKIEQEYANAKENLQSTLVGSLKGLASSLEQAGVESAGLQKTLALVDIATNTAKSLSNVIAGATAAAAATGPAAPYVLGGYIASGIAIVVSAIASARNALKSAPSIGGSVSGGGSPVSTSVASPATPSFELFGQNNDLNNLGDTEEVSNSQNINVTALVSEVELTATQKKQQKLQESATL